MEVPEYIFNWLSSIVSYDLPSPYDKFILPTDLSQSLESGHGMGLILKHLNQTKVTVI